NCAKKPKYGTYKYCGKTCADQAATRQRGTAHSQSKAPSAGHNRTAAPSAPQKAVQLCSYCGKKPKFRSFDYCGKSCAARANSAQSNQATTQGKHPTKQNGPRAPHTHHKLPPMHSNVTQAPQPQTRAAITQGNLSNEDDENDEDEGIDLSAYPTDEEYPTDADEETPSSVAAVPHQSPTANRVTNAGKRIPSRANHNTCAIPHCSRPVHVDQNGVTANYCSIKHREKQRREAVKLGLEAACIMCKRYPQSGTDYFCSVACRNQSTSK
ncbi:hypothetical protein ID866_8127, partial [Astraeus odoratus]